MKKILSLILGLLWAVPVMAVDYSNCQNLFDGEYISVNGGTKAENANKFYVSPGERYVALWTTSVPNALNLFEYNTQENIVRSWETGAYSPNGVSTPFSNNYNAWQTGAVFTVPDGVAYLRFNTFGTLNASQQQAWAESLKIYNMDCVEKIKIATTKYNENAFNPLNTALQNAISVVDSVVSNTITQAASIATLQTQKQTRPADDPSDANNAENCPAGKKCLLVEDASGIPHWYEIVEYVSLLPDGYTQLEYVENTDDTYISVGITVNSGEIFGQDIVMSVSADNTTGYTGIFGGAYFGVKDGYFALSNVIENIPFDTNKHRFLFSTNIGSSANQSLQIDDGEIYTASRNVQSGQVALFRVLSTSLTYWLKAKVYSATYRVNGNVVATLIPARRNSDNVVGMYDTTRNVFLAPTGTLTAGPVAE